ncbi:alpha/beta fold hydrolase [Candidatus Bipolaricaulota bacterium]
MNPSVRRIFLALSAVALLAVAGCQRIGPIADPTEIDPTSPRIPSAFQEAAPEDVGLSSEAVAELSAIVSRYVEDDRIVGAELLVLKNRRTVLHDAFGWKDRERELPMTIDTIFNIRSMTKPFTGGGAQILIDEGRLSLDDPVSRYLESFESEESGQITVEQLLTHRAGLPLTILATSIDEYPNLIEQASAVGERGPEFDPGSRFWYSDAGSDVLGAVVELVAETTLDAFVTQRLVEPLGMNSTFYYIASTRDDSRSERMASGYLTQGGSWSRFWIPDEPLYPFAWGSQTLYSSPRDYARFLAMWLDDGVWNGLQVLSPEATKRTLTPVSRMSQLGSDAGYPTGFHQLETHYGQMAMLYLDETSEDETPIVIGHGGSDGTMAWAWPEEDLMVLLFTQSRGNTAVLDFEAEIDRLLVHPEIEEWNAVAREQFEPFLGSYVPTSAPHIDHAFVVTVQNGTLALAVPGEITYDLVPSETRDQWSFKMYPEVLVIFDEELNGSVDRFTLSEGGSSDLFVRGEPTPAQPILLEDVEPLLGTYRDEVGNRDIEVVFTDGRLALVTPETLVPLELFPPNESREWALCLNPAVSIHFDFDEAGEVFSFTARSPEGEAVRPRVTSETRPAQDEPSSIPVEAEGESVRFSNGDVALAGILSFPDKPGPHPAVVLISGSGSQDRNEETPAIPGYRPFQWIAEHLVRHGMAVLRYDDRGVGESTGTRDEATSVDFAADAEAAWAYLVGRPEIDASRVGLIGHSEGGLHAAMIAARNPNVAFVVSLAGPATDGITVLQAQMRRVLEAAGAGEAEIERELVDQRASFDLALAGEWDALGGLLFDTYLAKLKALPEEVRVSLGDIEEAARLRASASAANLRSPYIRFFLSYDPGEDWRRITVPVLALFGDLDTQCDATLNRTALVEAMATAGNENFTIATIVTANHLFQNAETGSPLEYAELPMAFHAEFLPTVTSWLTEITGINP